MASLKRFTSDSISPCEALTRASDRVAFSDAASIFRSKSSAESKALATRLDAQPPFQSDGASERRGRDLASSAPFGLSDSALRQSTELDCPLLGDACAVPNRRPRRCNFALALATAASALRLSSGLFQTGDGLGLEFSSEKTLYLAIGLPATEPRTFDSG